MASIITLIIVSIILAIICVVVVITTLTIIMRIIISVGVAVIVAVMTITIIAIMIFHHIFNSQPLCHQCHPLWPNGHPSPKKSIDLTTCLTICARAVPRTPSEYNVDGEVELI